MKDTLVHEQARLWSAPDLGNLELRSATYLTHSFARHTHDEFMVAVIERGGCAFYYRGATHIATSSSVVLINPGEAHDGAAAAATPLTYRALYPDVATLQRVASEMAGKARGIPYFFGPALQDEPLSRRLHSLHLLLEESVSPLERESAFLLTFAELLARYAEHPPEAPDLGKEHRAVSQVRDYLEARAAEQVTLAHLASLTHLSPYHLVRVFRAEAGLPPHAYQTQVRVRQAKKLLMLGLPIPQVALETGFVDQSHLTRHFKRMVGVTPGHYQHERKNIQDRWLWHAYIG